MVPYGGDTAYWWASMCLPAFQVLLQTKKMEQTFHYLTCLGKSLLYKRKRIASKTGLEFCSHNVPTNMVD